jgi:uncharacterized protein involved in tolerance to divalent cations
MSRFHGCLNLFDRSVYYWEINVKETDRNDLTMQVISEKQDLFSF